ncbi:MAG: hypothetical protein V4719_06140 [Planctomycetota bacterium]
MGKKLRRQAEWRKPNGDYFEIRFVSSTAVAVSIFNAFDTQELVASAFPLTK